MICCDNVALYSNMGVGGGHLRVLSLCTYVSRVEMFKRSSLLYSSSSGTFKASTEGLGGNIGCRDKISSWYQKCITFVHVVATAVPQL